MANRQITYKIGFDVDGASVRKALDSVTKELQSIGTNPNYQLNTQLREASNAALDLAANLKSAFNQSTGKLDLATFRRNLAASGQDLASYGRSLSQIGIEGENAFYHLAQAITAADLPLKRTSELWDKLWVTMKNTARWRLTTGVLNTFVGTIQTAYGYAQDLNSSLNSIRIVTQQSAEDMDAFAKRANQAAKELNTTTTKYADASLIYYQQGLSDEEVEARTATTIKLANVANQTAQETSEQLTAVWNNFYDGSKSLEYYVDVMAKLGATTASSTAEISDGLQKFAPIAATVGLSYEAAAAALATLTATTRESADVVGTSLRTLFARIQGLKMGETLEDGVDLNKYSAALEAIGVKVLDASGNLREMDDILFEMGDRWQYLTKAQQVATAETVAGVRQYSQLIALMDNFDFFRENLATAMGAEGELQRQADIYAESWEAARDNVRAAAEDIYDSLINDDFYIQLDRMLSPILEFLASAIDGVGGLNGVLAITGTLINKIYGDRIAQGLQNFATNLSVLTGQEANAVRELQLQALQSIQKSPAGWGNTEGDTYRLQVLEEEVQLRAEINSKIDTLDSYQKFILQAEQDKLNLIKRQVEEYAKLVDETQRQVDVERSSIRGGLNSNNRIRAENELLDLNINLESMKVPESNWLDIDLSSATKAFDSINKELVELATRQAALSQLRAEFERLDTTIVGNEARIKELLVSLGLYDENTIKSIATTEELTNVLTGFEQESDVVSTKIGGLTNILMALADGSKNIKADDIRQYVKDILELAIAMENGKGSADNFSDAARRVNTSLREGLPTVQTWATTIVALGTSISQVSMVLSSFSSLVETVNNENLTSSQKLTSSLMSLSMIIGVVANVIPKAVAGFEALAAGGLGLSAALSAAFPILAVIGIAIGAAITLYQQYGNTAENASKKIKASAEEYEKAASAVEEYSEKIETANARIEELSNQDTLTLVEQEELDKLQEEISLLEREQDILERRAQLAKRDSFRDFWSNAEKSDTYRDLFTGPSGIVSDDVQTAYGEILDDLMREAGVKNWRDNMALSTYATIGSVEQGIYNLQRIQEQYGITTTAVERFRQATEDAWTVWQGDTLDTYNELKAQFEAGKELFAEGLISEEEFTEAYDKFVEVTRKRYENSASQFNQYVIDPVAASIIELQRPVAELRQAFSDSGSDLYKSIDAACKNAGISIEDLGNRFNQVIDGVQNKFNSFIPGLGDWATSMFDYDQLMLISQINADNFGDFYETLYRMTIETENMGLKTLEAINATYDALSIYASGKMLDDTTIKKIKESYAIIGQDIENFDQMTVPDQIAALAQINTYNEQWLQDQVQRIAALKEENDALRDRAVIERQIAELSGNVAGSALDRTGTLEQIQAYDQNALQDNAAQIAELTQEETVKIEAEVDLEEAKKQLEDFFEEWDDQNLVIGIDFDEHEFDNITAEIVNVRKAIELVNKDLTVSGKNIEELARRAPELLYNATKDASDTAIKLDQEVYDNYKATTYDRINLARDATLQAVQEKYNEVYQIYSLLQEAANNETVVNQSTLDNLAETEEEKKAIYTAATMAMIAEKVKQVIQEKAANAEEAANTNAAHMAMVESSRVNGQIMYSNFAKVAQAIADAFKEAIEAIAKGIAQLVALDPGATVQAAISQALGGLQGGQMVTVESVTSSSEFANQAQETRNMLTAANMFLDAGGKMTDSLEAFIEGTGLDSGKLFDYVAEGANALGIIASSQAIQDGGLQAAIEDAYGNGQFGQFNGNYDLADAAASGYGALLGDLAGTMQDLIADPGGSKSGGGGGGKKSGKGADPLDPKTLEEVRDRYHEINRELEHLSDLLDDIQNWSDRSVGSRRIQGLQAEAEMLNAELEAQQRKLADAQDYMNGNAEKRYVGDLNKLQALFQGTGATIKVDENGVLNYNELMEASAAKYNEFISAYNSQYAGIDFSEVDEDGSIAKYWQDSKKQADKEYKARTDALKQFEDTQDTIQDTTDKIEELQRAIEDNKLTQIEYILEVELDKKELDQSLLQLKKRIREAFGDALNYTPQSLRLGGQDIEIEIAKLKDYEDQMKALDDLWENRTDDTDRQRILEDREELISKIEGSADAMLDWLEEWTEAFTGALEAAQDRFDYFTTILDHNSSVLDVVKELMVLQGQSVKTADGFNNLQKAMQGSMQTSVVAAQVARQEYEGLYQMYQDAEAHLAQFEEGDIRWNQAKEERDKLLEMMQDAEDAMYESAKAAMEKAQEMYLQQIERAQYVFNKAISGGLGLDLLRDKYDHTIEVSERYLDRVNEAYEVASWYDKLNADIEKATTKAAKDRLEALRDEIDIRRQNNTLSQYDLDILEAKYNVLQAQLALEDALNAKTELRLVRDRQGNWNYQYTANQDDVDSAQAALLDANNEWYNIAKDRMIEITDAIITAWEEAEEKVAEVYNDLTLTTEEKTERIAEIWQYYTDKVQYLEEEKNIAITDMTEAGNSELLDISKTHSSLIVGLTGQTAEQLKALVQDATKDTIMNANLLDTTLQQDLSNMTQNTQNFETLFTQYIDSCKTAFAEYGNTMDRVADATGTDVDTLAEKVRTLTSDSETLGTKATAAIQSIFDNLEKVRQASRDMEELATKVDAALQKCIELEEHNIIEINVEYKEGAFPDVQRHKQTVTIDVVYQEHHYSSPSGSTSNGTGNGSDGGGGNGGFTIRDSQYPDWNFGSFDTKAEADAKIAEFQVDNWARNLYSAAEGATGMYTGTWPSAEGDPDFHNGKLAFLHQKELVLNATDTENILNAVYALRDIPASVFAAIEKILDGEALSAMSLMGSKIRSTSAFISNNSDDSARPIYVTAEFPNAYSASEIREALMSLPNIAAQRIGISDA